MNANPSPFARLTANGLAGLPSSFICRSSPESDWAAVQRLGKTAAQRGANDPVGLVAVLVHYLEEDETPADTYASLSPSDARRMAAALLNAADEIDGTTPLAFSPCLCGEEA